MTFQDSSNFLGPLSAFASSITWAIGSAGYSRMLARHSAFAINFVRALVALPAFVLMNFVVSGGLEQGLAGYQTVRLSHLGWFTLSMFSSYGLGDVLFLWSTRSLGVPIALAIASCYPIWTVMTGYWFGGEKLLPSQLVGLLIAVSGVVLLIVTGSPKGKRLSSDKTSGLGKISATGIALAFSTSIAWAMNSFAVSRGCIGLTPAIGNTIRMVVALILSSSLSRLLSPGTPVIFPAGEIYRYLWLFLTEACLGSFFFLYGLSHSPLAVGATLGSLAPVLSVPVTILLGVEKFSLIRTLGVTVVVTGICLLLQAL